MIHQLLQTKQNLLVTKFSFFCSLLLLMAALFSSSAHAVPSFARQTGMACTACHTQAFGPNLNPMGRDFKLKGYTMKNDTGDFNAKLPPISAMVVGSFTHTYKKDPGQTVKDDGVTSTGLNANNNATFDEAALFYAGRILPKLGAFAELNFNGVDKVLTLPSVDIRFADQMDVADYNVNYGVSVNNNPTSQDLWNTTPVWGYPDTLGVNNTTMLEGMFEGRVGGATAYMMLNNMLFLEAGAYASLAQNMQRGLGFMGSDAYHKIDGAAPYWRVALQHQIGGHYFSVGTFGMQADIFPNNDRSSGTDNISDLGADINYQFLGNMQHILEFKTSYIREDIKHTASQALGLADNAKNRLYSFRTNIGYTFDQTYSLSLGYLRTTGSTDATYFGTDSGKPNSEGFIAELSYVPFGKTTSLYSSWTNLRLSMKYIGYTRIDGRTKDFTTNTDGSPRNAGDNNTFLLSGTLIF